jgi:hypothetical protein
MAMRPPLKAILVTILILGAALTVRAQYPQSLSIDFIVARADQVLIGRVVNAADTTRDKDGRRGGTIVLSVEQTLKGSQLRAPLDLPIANWDDYYPGEFYAATSDSQINSHRLLVALRHDAKNRTRIAAIDLDSASLEIMRADLVVLKTSAEVIRAAQDEIHRIQPGDNRIDVFELRPPTYEIKTDLFYGHTIIVPADERLEKLAHTWLSDPGTRLRGLYALRFFKSDENIRLLTALVDDTDYSVRNEAAKILKGWGVDAANPALPVDANRPAPAAQSNPQEPPAPTANEIPDFEGTAKFIGAASACPAIIPPRTVSPFDKDTSSDISDFRIVGCWMGTLRSKDFVLVEYFGEQIGGGLAVRYGKSLVGTISTQAPPWIVRFTGEYACDADHAASYYRGINLRTGRQMEDDEAARLCWVPPPGKYVLGLKTKYRLEDVIPKHDLVRITFARPPDVAPPFGGGIPYEAQVPPGADTKGHGALADVVGNQISALKVTWSDPARFKSEAQTEELLRFLLSNSKTEMMTYHAWSSLDGFPSVMATVEHTAGKPGRLVIWSPPPGLYLAYLDGNGKWWWGYWDIVKFGLPPGVIAQPQVRPVSGVKSQGDQLKAVKKWEDLRKPESWQDFSADLIIPGTAHAPTRIEKITGKVAWYQTSAAPTDIFLGVISDPHTHFTYFTRAGVFYISDKSEMLACIFGPSSLGWGKSYFKIPTPPDKEQGAIQRFAAEMDEEKLLQADSKFTHISLVNGAPFEFFTANSAGGSQSAAPTITAAELTDGMLQLDLTSSGGVYHGHFWIDLNAQKLIRSVVDGKEMDITKMFGGFPTKH